MLFAVLTLIPAVISIIGPKIFWPSKAWQKPAKPGVSKWVGGVIARKPGMVAGVAAAILLVLAFGYGQLKTSYDFTSQQPQGTESSKAFKDVSKYFSAGAISPTEIYLTRASGFTSADATTVTNKVQALPKVSPAGPAVRSKDNKTVLIAVYLPGSADSNSSLDYMHDTFRPEVHRMASSLQATGYVAGESASFADVRSAVSRDLAVILPIAAIIIFVILVLLLRSILGPLYLLVAVALGFTATLGGTVYLFQGVQNNAGLIFFIPIMVYIFVVAIGTDYNILVMTRLREEVRGGLKPREAADMTLEHSGATVASAGIILAGTFGSLALAGISLLAQLGFAIAFGIMLSAFIIALLLVPSVAALLGYKVWWPGHKPAVDPNRK
jgi:RND superfamily putative drug exporter